MVEVQTFIDELKGIMKYYKVSKYQDTLDQIESLVAKYETIKDFGKTAQRSN